MADVKEPENFVKIEHSKGAETTVPIDKKGMEAAVDLVNTQSEVSAEVADLGIEDTEDEKSFSEREDSTKAQQNTHNRSSKKIKSFIHEELSSKQMQKEIIQKVRAEIRRKGKVVFLSYVGLKKISPDRLTAIVARMRKLKNLLFELPGTTKEVLTSLYLKWSRKES